MGFEEASELFAGLALLMIGLVVVVSVTKKQRTERDVEAFLFEAVKVQLDEDVGDLWFLSYVRELLKIARKVGLTLSEDRWEPVLLRLLENFEVIKAFDTPEERRAAIPILIGAILRCLLLGNDGGPGYAAGVNTLLVFGALQARHGTSTPNHEVERAFRYQHVDFEELYLNSDSTTRAEFLAEYKRCLRLVLQAQEADYVTGELADHLQNAPVPTVAS